MALLKGTKSLVATALLGLSACTMAPRYERPSAPVPSRYEGEQEQGEKTEVLTYTEFFKDPRLQRLISIALEENRELRIATLGAEKLRAQYRIRRAALFPEVSAAGARNQQRIVSPLFQGRGISYTQYTLSVGITSYELDFFGRIQSLKNQALENYLASVEAQRASELSLVAGLATQYFAEQALREQLARAEGIREAAAAARELTARAFEMGTKSAIDLKSMEAQLARIEAEREVIARRLALARNALVLLVGRPLPENLPEPLPLDTEELLPEIKAGLPSDLLQRRPDILAAEHALKAANAYIGAARAAFFPRISLTAAGGSASADFQSLFAGGGGTWQFMPQISVPLFAGGSRFAELDVSKIQKLTEIANYERAIQVAFREVADALAAQTHLVRERDARSVAASASRERYAMAEARYNAGLDSYLAVLTAQQDLFSAEQTLVQVRVDQLSNTISLYRALGGGFQ